VAMERLRNLNKKSAIIIGIGILVVVVFAIGIALLLTFHLRRDHNRIPLDDYNDIFLTVKGSLKSQRNVFLNTIVILIS
jgi:hypothetical protein